MAIQPIDLQTMYTQLDKISKTTVAQQQGAQIARTMQQEELQRQEFLKSETVKELHTEDEKITPVDDKNSENAQKQKNKQKKQQQEEEKNAEQKQFFWNEPHLGRNIDVSG